MSTAPPKPKPGGWSFLVPVIIWIASSVVAVVLLVNGFSRYSAIIDDFHRVEDGTEATVTLDRGGHTIWLERPGADEEFFSLPPLDVEITAPDGTSVSTSLYSGDVSYTESSRDGVAVLTFTAPTAGEYTIAPTVDDFRGGTIAIGTENPLRAIGLGFALFFGVGIVGFLIALVVLIVILVKRSRSKKQIRATQAAAFGYPPQGGYAAPSPYGGPAGYPQPGGYAPQGGYGGYPPQGGDGAPGSSPPPPGGYGTPPPGSAPGSQPWGGPSSPPPPPPPPPPS